MSKMTKIEDREEEISEKLKKMYERINETVQYMIAVPAYQVFVSFNRTLPFNPTKNQNSAYV